jgi:hypothetical protein
MKIKLLFLALLFSTLGWGQTTIFTENMYNGVGGVAGDAIATHETNNRFNEDGLTYSGTGDMRNTLASTGYAGASGTWNAYLNAAGETFIIDGINATSYTNLVFSYGVRKNTNGENGTGLIAEYSTTGIAGAYTAFTYPGPLTTGAGTSIWYLRTADNVIPNTITTIRFRMPAANDFRIDDVLLTGSISCTSPITQASSLTASNPTVGGFDLAWTAGNGNGTMVVVRPTATVNTLPSSSTAYAASLDWTTAGQIDTNNRVVFRGAGTAAAPIIGLTPGTQYTITAYEYNTVGNCYNLTSPTTTTIYTLSAEPTAHAASFSCLTSSATQINLTFPVRSLIPNARAYIILQSAGALPTGVPLDGTAYVAGDVIGDATVVGTTILDGADTTFSATGLSPSITYYFTLIPYNLVTGIPSTLNYLTVATIPSSNCTTLAGACYTTSFEDASKTSYPSADVTLSGVVWNMTESLIGTAVGDYKVGLKSARLRSDASTALEMQQDKTTGIGTISFNYKIYGTDVSQGNYKVEYSKDGSNSWIQIGTEFTATTAIQTFSATLNQAGPVRLRIVYSSGPQGTFRTNIDEVQLCNFTDTKEIEVYGNNTTIQNGSLTYTTINDTDYGDGFFVGDAPIVKTFTITNRGTGTLNLSSLALSGDASFTITSGLSSSALAAGASATFNVSFAALTPGVKTTLVTIGNDDSNENPFTFTLRALSSNYIKCALNAKQIIGQQDFEVAPAIPTLTYTNTGGVVAGGTNYGDNRLTKTNMFIGAQSFQETGTLQILTFATTDVSDYKNVDFTFNIGAYTTVTTPAGLDASDYVKVFVSKDGGATWIPQVKITGFSNSIFDINTAPGATINHTYNPNLTAGVRYAPLSSSTNTFTKTFVIKSLPNVSQLRVKIELATDSANEIWVIDNAKLEGQLPQSTTWNGATWSAGAPIATKKAIFDGDYSTSIANIETCDCEIKATRTVTVLPTNYVKIHSDIKNSGSLLVQDQGSLVMVNDAALITNTGTMQVKRKTTPYEKFDYTYWSSPVNTTIGQALGTWRNDYTFRFETANFSDITTAATGLPPADGFDDNRDDWILMSQIAPMLPAKGYIAMAPTTGLFPAITEVTFQGTVNNGVITTPIFLSANPANLNDDYNLVGNPYPSAIYANDFINANTNITGTLYLWTHIDNLSIVNPGPDTYNFSPDDYAYYNLTGGTSSINGGAFPSGYIASGQGFVVEALTPGNLTFNNSMRSSAYTNTNFYRNANQNNANQNNVSDRIWLNMQNDLGMFSQQLIGYIPGTTLGHDWAYDGIRSKPSTYIHFYSNAINNEEYKIQSRGNFDLNDIVSLGFRSEYAGQYKISISNIEGQLSLLDHVFIEDKLLNTIHDLKQSPYTFTTEVGKFDNRFFLRYNNQILGNNDFELLSNTVFVSNTADQIMISSKLENIKSYDIYDVLGRKLATQNDINKNTATATSIVRNNQALIVKVTLENGQEVTKKIIF